MLHHGKEPPPLTIISDRTYADGIVRHTLQNLTSTSSSSIIGLCYQHPALTYQSYLDGNSQVEFHDFFSDPFSWFTESSCSDTLKAEFCTRKTSSSEEKRVIFIDDLLLWGRSWGCIDSNGSWDGLVQLLHSICQNNYIVVALVHPDLVSDANLRILAHLAQFHVTADVHPHIKGGLKYHSVLRKSSGKVVVEDKVFVVDGDGVSLREIDERAADDQHSVTTDPDPASNLTFNLRLTETEKVARANTALPYILNESKKSAYLEESGNQVKTHASSGDVVYLPDEADDFDDEDPDDDLDF